MSIKQVLVLRTRYPDGKGGFFKPRTGKLVAQGAHASMAALLGRFPADLFGYVWRAGDSLEFNSEDEDTNPGDPALLMALHPDAAAWLGGKFTKICVGVESEEQLLDIYRKAELAGVLCSLIQDNGDTEFGGVPTYTSVAVGPANSEVLDPITGHLKLL
jgi:peptidyl-tRNA hydrolase, PTH2 family